MNVFYLYMLAINNQIITDKMSYFIDEISPSGPDSQRVLDFSSDDP